MVKKYRFFQCLIKGVISRVILIKQIKEYYDASWWWLKRVYEDRDNVFTYWKVLKKKKKKRTLKQLRGETCEWRQDSVVTLFFWKYSNSWIEIECENLCQFVLLFWSEVKDLILGLLSSFMLLFLFLFLALSI